MNQACAPLSLREEIVPKRWTVVPRYTDGKVVSDVSSIDEQRRLEIIERADGVCRDLDTYLAHDEYAGTYWGRHTVEAVCGYGPRPGGRYLNNLLAEGLLRRSRHLKP